MNATRKTGNYWRYGRQILHAALAALVMAAIGVSQVQADVDGKIYPASMCVRWAGSEPLLEHSRLFNTGSAALRLDCPIVRDIIGGFIPGVQDGYLDVINNHGTEQVCAELVAVSQVESATLLAAEVAYLQADKEQLARLAGELKSDLTALRAQLARVTQEQEASGRKITHLVEKMSQAGSQTVPAPARDEKAAACVAHRARA